MILSVHLTFFFVWNAGTEYGRLMYMMMDALKNDVQQLLGFNVAKPIVTVYAFTIILRVCWSLNVCLTTSLQLFVLARQSS